MTKQDHTTTCAYKSNPSQVRQIKVREAYHSYQLQQNYPDRTPIGEIQLKGHWLIQAGFTIDTPVQIRIMEGCMVLTTDKRPTG